MLYLRTRGAAGSSDSSDDRYPMAWYRPLFPLFARRWPRGRWVSVRRESTPLVKRMPAA